MPSRRAFLSGTVALSASAVGGCLTRVGLAKTGYLQLKAVSVQWTHRGRTYRDEVVRLISDGQSELSGAVAEQYREVVTAPNDVTVSDAVHDSLERDFETVQYLLGFCGERFPHESDERQGCRNTQAPRRGFNRVQFGDRAEVRIVDNEFRVVDVYEGAAGDPTAWETEMRTFDFEERHAEHGR